MTREARDATFDTSDGSAIAFTLHGAPRTGAPRLALIHLLALDRRVWDGVAATMGSDVELLTYDCRGHGRSGRRATTFTAELPHSTLTVLPGARHLTPIECRDQISSQLLTVLRRS
jgi:pimeloyl-ACP methyl ester carboxylesterase